MKRHANICGSGLVGPVNFDLVLSFFLFLSPAYVKQALRVFGLLWASFFFLTTTLVGVSSYGAVAELPASAIVEASQLVMAGTLKARQLIDGRDSVLYQKRLASGGIVSRSEMRLPNAPTNKVVMVTTHGHYELYPDYNLAVDMSAIAGVSSIKSRTAQLSATAEIKNKPPQEAIAKGKVMERGVECHRIDVSIGSSAIRAAMQMLIARSNIASGSVPARYEYTIGVQDMIMRKSVLVSEAGTVISATEFLEVELNPELSDTLFEMPTGMTLQRPGTTADYANLMVRTFYPPRATPPSKVVFHRTPHIDYQPVVSIPPSAVMPSTKQNQNIPKYAPVVVATVVCLNFVLVGILLLRKYRNQYSTER